jgi:hypothetical protein
MGLRMFYKLPAWIRDKDDGMNAPRIALTAKTIIRNKTSAFDAFSSVMFGRYPKFRLNGMSKNHVTTQ